MNVYNILKYFSRIGGNRLKLAAILCAHLCRRRYVGVFMDPVLACNLRCRMCFFSDKSQSVNMRGQRINDGQIKSISRILLPRCIKLQLGCSAEPTLYTHLPELIAAAKRARVPYISITTNGQLLTPSLLKKYIDAGLNEVTMSVHGFTPKTYEYLMNGAKWENFTAAIDTLKKAKRDYPNLKVRINYVANDMNTPELTRIWDVLDGLKPDILQIRPVQRLGNTDYNNFDLSQLKDEYSNTIEPIKLKCKNCGITCIAPTLENLTLVNRNNPWMSKRMEELTYYYVAPNSSNHPEMDLNEKSNDSFANYHKRVKTVQKLWHDITHSIPKESSDVKDTKKLNYNID